MVAVLEPVRYGPDPDELPPLTLGWDVLDWASANLVNLDGEPWIFTPEQARFVLHWYAIREDGRWRYRRGVLRRLKGWGKDPLGAVLCVVEWIGPCRFGGFYEDGEPAVVPATAPLVQVSGVSLDQVRRNTMSLFPAIIPRALEDRLNLSIGTDILRAPGGRTIEAISSGQRAEEGARVSFALCGETQHWVSSNGGHGLMAVINRNLAKSPGGTARSLAITNAHGDGEDSVAERDYNARDAADVLYDSIEAPPGLDVSNDDDVMAGILAARGDSVWLDVERILADFRDPASDESLNVRFFHNRIVAGSGRFLPPSTWDAATVPPQRPRAGRKVTLGFDGSRTRDATALVGTDLETGLQWLEAVWERDYNDPAWEVPVDTPEDGSVLGVRDAVALAFDRYHVMRMYADPAWWEESVSEWAGRHKRPDGKDAVAAFWVQNQRLRMARALRAWLDALESGSCSVVADALDVERDTFRRHALAAHKRPLDGNAGEDGLALIYKASRDSTDVIDGAMAAALSWQACLDARANGDLDLRVDPVRLRVALPSWMRDDAEPPR